ncbi:MAG TPA: LysR family transcriptional regulator [Phycisphaerae bacterium]|nr:LysR family transcriptional regulator [Phycisphaerae bacterium]
MNTNVMKVFCDLVDTGSFSKAAEANGISQPAVSQQVAGLEREMGTSLLTRASGFVAPTDAGKALYRGGKEILRRCEQMVAEVRALEEMARPALRVGTIYSVGFYLLEPYVRKFLRAHPDVNLDVEYARWNTITAAVLDGDMDLGILAFPEKHRSIEAIQFATEDMVMVCSPSHRLANRETIVPSDLKGEAFVAFEDSVPTRRYIDRVLKGYRVAVDIAMKFDNNETLKRAVEVGAGLSILPRDNVEREAAAGHLCIVPFREPARWTRKISIIRRRGQAHSKLEMMFLRVLRSRI